MEENENAYEKTGYTTSLYIIERGNGPKTPTPLSNQSQTH